MIILMNEVLKTNRKDISLFCPDSFIQNCSYIVYPSKMKGSFRDNLYCRSRIASLSLPRYVKEATKGQFTAYINVAVLCSNCTHKFVAGGPQAGRWDSPY